MAVVKEMVFHLDPRKAEARVQLTGFQRVNEKGNRKIKSDIEREKEYLCVWWRKRENEGNSKK